MTRFARICAIFGLVVVVAGCSMATKRSYGGSMVVDGVRITKDSWRKHFKSVRKGAIRVDLSNRVLTYWSPGAKQVYVFPIAVPRSTDLQRRGRTKVVRRKAGPGWAPTPAMRRREPDLPAYIPPGPQNPLGEYALYLGWRYYAIHGTNNQNSVGRRATSGCFRLRSRDIEFLFKNVQTGTPVVVDGRVSGPYRRLR